MSRLVSLIVPNRNGSATIGRCLEAVFRSNYGSIELIVVDDHSADDSVQVIRQYPCILLRLESHDGAAAARNAGAERAKGDVLFFIDADCLLQTDTIALAVDSLAREGATAIIGGTYTLDPADSDFFSRFQSVFINYFETRRAPAADYIATHALAMDATVFRASGGFDECVRPILEDVEFSHRLRSAGCRLVMNPAIRVQHIFNFSLMRSLRNAFIKSQHWTRYTIDHRNLLTDSGSASLGLKLNVLVLAGSAGLLSAFFLTGNMAFLVIMVLPFAANLFVNRGLLLAFYRVRGCGFALGATLYYLVPYAFAVGVGAGVGMLRHLFSRFLSPRGHA